MRVEWHEAATAAGRHPPPRLIPSRRSVAPISEDRERPRNHFRGRFRFSVRKERHSTRARSFATRTASLTRFFAHTFPANAFPQHHSANARTSRSARGSSLSRSSATRRASAAPRCSVRATAGCAWAHGLPVGDGRRCDASIERSPAARVRIPSGARGVAVAYARAGKWCFDKATLAQRESGGASRRLPVRFRHVVPLDSSTVEHRIQDSTFAGSTPAPDMT